MGNAKKVFSFARGEAWQNPDFIVNRVTHIVGKTKLDGYRIHDAGRDAKKLCALLWDHVTKQLSHMKTNTLAEIGVYGGWDGFDNGLPYAKDFQNFTGWSDVVDEPMNLIYEDFRSVAEQLAALTIICVARDIMLQDEWQANVAHDLALDEEFDRGMRDYIHGKPSHQFDR